MKEFDTPLPQVDDVLYFPGKGSYICHTSPVTESGIIPWIDAEPEVWQPLAGDIRWGFLYRFSSNTSDGLPNPTAGYFRFSAASGSTLTIRIHAEDYEGNDLRKLLDTLYYKAIIYISRPNPNDPAYRIFKLSNNGIPGGSADLTSYDRAWTFAQVLGSQGTLEDNEVLRVMIFPAGDKGDTGLNGDNGADGVDGQDGNDGFDGITIPMRFSTATEAGAAGGRVRRNNASFASTTTLYFSNEDLNTVNTTPLLSLINSGSVVHLRKLDNTAYAFYKALGSVVAESGYLSLPVEYLAHLGSFADETDLSVGLMLRGPAGESNADVWLLEPCRAATTESITLSGLQTVDGVSLAGGDRVLVKDQGSATANGIYLAASGSWERATDLDDAAKFRQGLGVAILAGTDQENTIWLLKSAVSTLGADPVNWEQVQGSGESGGGGTLGSYQVLTGNNTVPAVNNTYLILPGNSVTEIIRLPANEDCEVGDWLEFMSDATQQVVLKANVDQAIIVSQSANYTLNDIPASNFRLYASNGGNTYEGVGCRLVYLGTDENEQLKEFDINGDPVLDEYDNQLYYTPVGGTGVWKLFYSTSYLSS
ncbi:hypothetical protein RIF25_07135 [Thermosynechococcaceae cyanobacterium BACA0444]|uniref:Uncharacterized protein n=1 Tax=Pseudocalidococcus azoricus BACA0444 TaxID=2918990 RepID=A0AAE4FQW1_9CYAN|nr:hypothetical protein [Pseudocalidococcus azoricus]MDS3860583.1 hypothetical protein [Pseudocalidococcus azoricus BACA0444]